MTKGRLTSDHPLAPMVAMRLLRFERPKLASQPPGYAEANVWCPDHSSTHHAAMASSQIASEGSTPMRQPRKKASPSSTSEGSVNVKHPKLGVCGLWDVY